MKRGRGDGLAKVMARFVVLSAAKDLLFAPRKRVLRWWLRTTLFAC